MCFRVEGLACGDYLERFSKRDERGPFLFLPELSRNPKLGCDVVVSSVVFFFSVDCLYLDGRSNKKSPFSILLIREAGVELNGFALRIIIVVICIRHDQ